MTQVPDVVDERVDRWGEDALAEQSVQQVDDNAQESAVWLWEAEVRVDAALQEQVHEGCGYFRRSNNDSGKLEFWLSRRHSTARSKANMFI